MPASAGSSQAITGIVNSHSYGLTGSVKLAGLPISLGTVADVVYDGSVAGPIPGGLLNLNVTGAAAASAITTSANGDWLADTATSSSSIAGLDVAGLIGANAVATSCTTASPGVAPTASATVTGLSSGGLLGTLGLNLGTLPLGAAPPNTDVPISLLGATVGHLYLNTQTAASNTTTPGASRTTSVDALHLVINALGLAVVDVTVGHSDCTTDVPYAPTIDASGLSPTQGPQVGGTSLTITGTHFIGASDVQIDGVSVPAANVTRVSDTQLIVKTPAHAPGPAVVKVFNATAPLGVAAAQSFTYLPTPTITGLAPDSGLAVGGNTVTITGTGFGSPASVSFGGTPATSVVYVNPTTITATVPAGTGSKFVQVTVPGGTSVAGPASSYTYYSVPTLGSISPTSGPTTGGTTLTLTGTNFTSPGTTVTIDGISQTVTYTSATSVQVTTPAHAAGTVPVVVTTPGGTTSSQTFTYLAIPTFTSLTPTFGSILGGDTVTISGTGLGSVTSVDMGGTATIIQGTRTPTSLQVTTPVHLPGQVSVVLTGPGTITTAAGNYTYTATPLVDPSAPTVTSLAPANGPQSGGGVPVVITGTNLAAATSVLFGAVTIPAASFVAPATATTITVNAPAVSSSGPVSVTVTTPVATSVISAGSIYVYDPLTPGLTSLSPNRGPITGGTAVTLTGSAFTPVSTVLLNGTTTISSTYVDATHITATMPPHAAGPVDLTVQTLFLTSGARTFTYLPATTVSTLAPDNGSTVGGTTVTVTGTNLDQVQTVKVGGTDVTPTIGSAASLSFVTPAHAAGPASVLLTNSDGLSLSAGTFTYVQPAPVAGSVSPNHGPLAGGNSITVTGTNLTGVTGVTVGGVAATSVNVVDSTHVSATVPGGAAAGATTLSVTGPGGISGTLAYTYDPVPAVTGISPNQGPATGGTTVTVTGTDFTGSTGVEFGGVAGTSFNYVNATTITVVSPVHAAGPVDVTVTGPNGTSAAVTAGRFTFIDTTTTPVISGLTPAVGATAGGTSVTVTGTGLFNASSVTFGGTAGTSLNVVDDNTLTVTAPAHTAGTFDVIVAKPGPLASSGAGTANDFTYVAPGSPAVVGSISPSRGPLSGGTVVYLSGVGFTGATVVTVGGTAVPLPGFTVISDTQISVTTPAHAAGTANITVTTGAGTSTGTNDDLFTYVNPPRIDAVSPTTGPAAGGTAIQITGVGFTGATAVNFGSTPGTSVLVTSDTTIDVISPQHAVGLVDVTVIGVGGTSTTAAPTDNDFTYLPAPTVTNLSQTSGPASGGTVVVITGTNFTGTTTVDFGGVAGVTPVVSNGGTTITVTSPVHAAGLVDVVVTSSGGTSAITAADQFTFLPPVATVGSLNPTSGPVAGGTTVTVTGTGFTGATGVNFGATAGTNVVISSPTSLTVTSPAHAAGAVPVTVVNPGGTSNGVTFTYNPLPVLTSMLPTSGTITGGTAVTLTGTGFTGATAVQFGGVNGTNITGVTSTSITVTTPAHAFGAVDVIVLGPNGASAPGPQFSYTQPTPAITTVNPTSGPEGGGTAVTVTGSGFTGATAVNFGATPGTNVVISSDTSLSVTSPLHAPGLVQITVVSPGGTSPGSAFTYNPGPAITAPLSPANGSPAGGTSVTITGTGFTGATSVKFDGINGTGLTINSPTSITVTSPAHAAGPVDVRVTTPAGISPVVAFGQFVYNAVPTVGTVSPSAGPTAGGTDVTITGTGFTGATAVTFGGVAATTFTVVNDTTITATAPAHASGSAPIVVTTPGGTSTGGPIFSYAAPGSAPVVGSVSPSRGPVAGGNRVTISGVGLTGATRVLFGSVAGTGLVVVNDTTITVLVPAGSTAGGQVDVTVTGPNGISLPRVGATYTYIPLTELPTVSAVTPEVGPVAGGTTLTITGTHFDATTTVSFDGVRGTGVTLGPDVGTAFLRRGLAVSGTGFRAAYSNQLTVISPAHAAGPVTLTLTNVAGSASFAEAFTFIPLLRASTVRATVSAGSRTRFAVGGAAYIELKATTCSEPAGKGSTQLAANQLSCTYTAPDTAGTQTFTMSLVDVLGQTATRTVTVTVEDEGGTGTGGGGGNDTDGGDNGGTGTGGGGGNDTDGGDNGGGTGTGGGGGNDTDGGDGSGDGSGSGGLAFTGAPYLLVPGLIGGLVLLLVGSGLLTGDRLRTISASRTGRTGTTDAGISLVTRGRKNDEDDDSPHDDAA